MDFILETLKRHTWKLAVGGSAAVLLAGVNLVDGKTTWWAPLVAFAGLVIVLFLSTNAGVVIKSALVTLLVMALVSVAVMSSSFGTGAGGVLWGVSILALAFVQLPPRAVPVPVERPWRRSVRGFRGLLGGERTRRVEHAVGERCRVGSWRFAFLHDDPSPEP